MRVRISPVPPIGSLPKGYLLTNFLGRKLIRSNLGGYSLARPSVSRADSRRSDSYTRSRDLVAQWTGCQAANLDAARSSLAEIAVWPG